MRMLVATALTQGARAGDYHWCVEGEPVWVQEPCAADRRDPDGPCGCGRGFAGLHSHRATTTVRVIENAGFTRDDLVLALEASLGDVSDFYQTPVMEILQEEGVFILRVDGCANR